MRGEAYERYIASIYEEDGFTTTLTRRNADKGIDVLAEKDGFRVAIQAKHYSRGNKVSSPDIQKAAGLLMRPDIHGVIVVTTSSFTRPAREVARNRGVELQQIGYNPSPSPDNNNSKTNEQSSETTSNYDEVWNEQDEEERYIKIGKNMAWIYILGTFFPAFFISFSVDMFAEQYSPKDDIPPMFTDFTSTFPRYVGFLIWGVLSWILILTYAPTPLLTLIVIGSLLGVFAVTRETIDKFKSD